ncbi:MAG TPA: histidine phosphatase family protein [Pirellulales bacterium]|jgi:probable phosphoglycerate mutase|nr:histidine phosphatase family protein [Pirellulales bacterium]
MILYCVRHGETVFNAAGRIQGQTDSELSDLGRGQCQAVAAAFAGQPIEAIYTSPLRRAREGAACVAEKLGLPVIEDARLMEIHAGIFQGLDWADIQVRYPREAIAWRTQDPDFRIPGGESRRDLMNRMGAALRDIRETGRRQVIIVAHGGSLSAGIKVLLEIPAQRNPFTLGNGSISTLVWEREIKLLTLNATDHLHGAIGGGGDL